jgi:hypothetical protein
MRGVDRIHLAHNRYQWRAVVNEVMNLRLPDKRVKPGNLPTTSGRVCTRQQVAEYALFTNSLSRVTEATTASTAFTAPIQLIPFL